jgi:hypothetical protein
MCCFSKPVISVSGTNIFARPQADGRQLLVYSMTLHAKKDLAMILPLPVKTPAGEKDVKFIDLKGYPEFFRDLKIGFSDPVAESKSRRYGGPAPTASAALEVIQVGSFEASFVPTQQDFSRLDERFRLPRDAWKQLPAYETYGFAVFKLKPGAMKVHPMAFSFPRRLTKTLFFPTVHIHDGKVHEKAQFDHSLYCQPTHSERPRTNGWEESYSHPVNFMQMKKVKEVVLADQHCYKKEIRGMATNRDIFLAVEGWDWHESEVMLTDCGSADYHLRVLPNWY